MWKTFAHNLYILRKVSALNQLYRIFIKKIYDFNKIILNKVDFLSINLPLFFYNEYFLCFDSFFYHELIFLG